MSSHDPIIKLHRKSMTATIAGILVVSVVIGILTVYPFYKNLKDERTRDFQRFGLALQTRIQGYMSEITNIARQITSRTKARKTLVAYNKHQISLSSAGQVIGDILTDVPRHSPAVMGISRFSAGGVRVTTVGQHLPSDFSSTSSFSHTEVSYHTRYRINNHFVLIVDAPIKDRHDVRVGNDIVIFQTARLENILLQGGIIYPGNRLSLACHSKDGNKVLYATGDYQAVGESGNILQYTYSIKNTNMHLHVSIDHNTVYHLVNTEITRLIALVTGISLFVSLGIYFLGRRFQGYIAEEIRLRESKESEIEELNLHLQDKVSTELHKRQKQQQLLFQQSKMAAMGEMIGAIAHQLKQPLNAISLSAQFIGEIWDSKIDSSDELSEAEQAILAQVDLMEHTINNFRRFFDPAGKETLFKPCELFDKVFNLMTHKMKTLNVSLVIHQHDCFQIYGTSNYFENVVLNLFNNAGDVFEERHINHGKIEVLFEKNQTHVVMRIRDNGGGITDEMLPDKLFNAYTSSKGDRGTGIGLHISRLIIEEKYAGKLSAHNYGDGAEFVLELPVSHIKPAQLAVSEG